MLVQHKQINKPLLKVYNTTNENINDNFKKIYSNNSNILISTPGRLSDLINKSGEISKSIFKKALKNVEFLIIDEADRVLSDNYKEQIDNILPNLAKQRRTSLFSATLDKEEEILVKMLARAGLRNPIKIIVKEKFQVSDLNDKNIENLEILKKLKTFEF